MNIVKTLILKDIYEYKNNYKKFLFYVVFMITFITGFFRIFDISNSPILYDVNFLFQMIVIVYSMFMYCETTLFQTHRYIKEGVYEKIFINKNVKKYQIVISKYILNLIITYFMFFTTVMINNIANTITGKVFTLNITMSLLFTILLACCIGTCLAFMNALIIEDEKNAMTYGVSVLCIYIGYYKLLELIGIDYMKYDYLYQIVVCILLVGVVSLLMNKNKFMKRS